MIETTLILKSPTREELELALVRELRGMGYCVEKPRDWERIADFAKRLGVTTTHVIRRLDDPRCPLPAECVLRAARGKGRRSHLAATPAFEKFCLENKEIK